MNTSQGHHEDTSAMTRKERDDLAKLTLKRERLAKAMAAQRSAELLADFEQQMASVCSFDDDEVWREASAAATQAAEVAQAAVDARCDELGIPKPFRPSIDSPIWSHRGENAVAARRAELRKVAQTRITAMEKNARRRIEAASLEIQTKLLAEGLTSDAVHRLLEAMPTVEALMPPLVFEQVEALEGKTMRDRSGDSLAVCGGPF